MFNSSDLHHNDLEGAIFSKLGDRISRIEADSQTGSPTENAKSRDTEEILKFFAFRGTMFHHLLEGLGVWFFRFLAALGGYAFFDIYGKMYCRPRRFSLRKTKNTNRFRNL